MLKLPTAKNKGIVFCYFYDCVHTVIIGRTLTFCFATNFTFMGYDKFVAV